MSITKRTCSQYRTDINITPRPFIKYIKLSHFTTRDKRKFVCNDVAIEFISYLDNRYENDVISYAAIITKKDWKTPQIVAFATEELLKSGIQRIQQGDSLSLNLHRLYNHIWKYITKNILSINDNIYFSASGMLHQIPIESLPVGNGKS